MNQYAKAGTLYGWGLISIGETLIKEVCRDAAKAFLKTVTSAEQAWDIQQSLAFIRGSGLEAAISTFALSYEPQQLRASFFRCGQRCQQSAS